MPRRSVRDNKTLFQTIREELGLSREAAAELLECISADRIDKIEREVSLPAPDEVLRMAECYRSPVLCNYYCSNKCEIGQKYVPEVEIKSLSDITISMLNQINKLYSDKDRLIEIVSDGSITPDEMKDFQEIRDNLDKMSICIDSMKLWIDNELASDN